VVLLLKLGEVVLPGCGDAFSDCNGSSAFFFPGSGHLDKSGNLEYRTSHEILDVSLKREPHLYVSLAAAY
jgi:hypothetical protein